MAVSERPWGRFSPADYETAGAYCDACLINLNTGPRADWSKGECKLPVYEPNGDLNRNGVHAAAAALAGARGGVAAPPAAKRAAARKAVNLYGRLEEEAPESVRRLAS